MAVYGGLIAVLFAGVGIWLGVTIRRRRSVVVVEDPRAAEAFRARRGTAGRAGSHGPRALTLPLIDDLRPPARRRPRLHLDVGRGTGGVLRHPFVPRGRRRRAAHVRPRPRGRCADRGRRRRLLRRGVPGRLFPAHAAVRRAVLGVHGRARAGGGRERPGDRRDRAPGADAEGPLRPSADQRGADLRHLVPGRPRGGGDLGGDPHTGRKPRPTPGRAARGCASAEAAARSRSRVPPFALVESARSVAAGRAGSTTVAYHHRANPRHGGSP